MTLLSIANRSRWEPLSQAADLGFSGVLQTPAFAFGWSGGAGSDASWPMGVVALQGLGAWKSRRTDAGTSEARVGPCELTRLAASKHTLLQNTAVAHLFICFTFDNAGVDLI